MARKKKAAAKPKAAAKRETTRRRPAVVEPEPSEEVDDPMALAMILLTGVSLLAATVITMMHLGSYGAGPLG